MARRGHLRHLADTAIRRQANPAHDEAAVVPQGAEHIVISVVVWLGVMRLWVSMAFCLSFSALYQKPSRMGQLVFLFCFPVSSLSFLFNIVFRLFFESRSISGYFIHQS